MNDEFCIAKDDSGHAYVIPYASRQRFNELVEKVDTMTDEEWAEWDEKFESCRIDGGTLVFKEWRIA